MNPIKLKEYFLSVLAKAQKERKKRPEMVEMVSPWKGSPVFQTTGWHKYEMETLHNAINSERQKIGKSDIDMKDLLRVESSAAGHVDYTSKLSFYAAELVYTCYEEVLRRG